MWALKNYAFSSQTYFWWALSLPSCPHAYNDRFWAVIMGGKRSVCCLYLLRFKDDDKKNNQMGRIMGRKVLQKKSLFATKLIWKNSLAFFDIWFKMLIDSSSHVSKKIRGDQFENYVKYPFGLWVHHPVWWYEGCKWFQALLKHFSLADCQTACFKECVKICLNIMLLIPQGSTCQIHFSSRAFVNFLMNTEKHTHNSHLFSNS